MFGVLERQNRVVECLLGARADPNILYCRAWSLMHAATDSGSALRASVLHKAEIYYTTDLGWTPLMQSVIWESKDCVKTLKEAGTSIDSANNKG